MALRSINTQPAPITVLKPITSITEYVFDTPTTLPEGNWALTIEKGYAWVFCNRGDFVLNAGESATLNASDGPIRIRSLYTKGAVKYQANKFA